MSAMSTNFRGSTRRGLQAFNNNYGDGGYLGDIQKIQSLSSILRINFGLQKSPGVSERLLKESFSDLHVFQILQKSIPRDIRHVYKF